MSDVAERARRVVCAADGLAISGRIVAALMADPELLVDLAIEAGGLEHPESVFEVFTAGDGHPSMRGRSDLYERVVDHG